MATKIPTYFLTHDQFTDAFRVPLRVPMDVDASCGKKWPEIDTQNQGLCTDTQGVIGIRKDKTMDTEGVLVGQANQGL
jgi:hypothetical protein